MGLVCAYWTRQEEALFPRYWWFSVTGFAVIVTEFVGGLPVLLNLLVILRPRRIDLFLRSYVQFDILRWIHLNRCLCSRLFQNRLRASLVPR